jgi:hypothetical protein
MAWRYFGLWRQYYPAWADPVIPTTYLTDGQMDWYDLAHGKAKEMGVFVPEGGFWLSVHPISRRVDKLREAKEMQFCSPAGANKTGMELWWTDEMPPEYPYEAENGNLFLVLQDGTRKLTYEPPEQLVDTTPTLPGETARGARK